MVAAMGHLPDRRNAGHFSVSIIDGKTVKSIEVGLHPSGMIVEVRVQPSPAPECSQEVAAEDDQHHGHRQRADLDGQQVVDAKLGEKGALAGIGTGHHMGVAGDGPRNFAL